MSSSPENPSSLRPLVLVPTQPECHRLRQAGIECEIVGFGPVAAAARAAALVATFQPTQVILMGVAGSYDEARLAPGQAAAFDQLALWGVGAGQGADFQSAQQMGWDLWPCTDERPAVGEVLPAASGQGLLVTVCAAGGDPTQVAPILARHPGALAEDMEAFGVALACLQAGVPLHCLRGISNRAGDRDKSHWRLREALDAVAALALESFPHLHSTPA